MESGANVMEASFLLNREGIPVRCILSEPDDGVIRRVVICVHGMGGSTQDTIQRGITEEMTLFSSAVFRFDMPSHGESPVEELTLDGCVRSLLTVAEVAKERYPQIQDLCIFATGFGAYVTLATLDRLTQLPGKIRLVVQTPSVRMDLILKAMYGIGPETLWAMNRFRLRLSGRPIDVTYSFFEELVENFVIAPYPVSMLILWAEHEQYTRRSDVDALRKYNDSSRLVVIPGTTHEFQEEGAWDMVLDLTRDWFEFGQVLLCDWE